jgi:hypothetical protein
VTRKLTGSGIVSWLRGTQNDAANAAAAVKLYGSSLDFVTTAMNAGATAEEAHSKALGVFVQKAKDAVDIQERLIQQGKPAWAAVDAQTTSYKYLADQLLKLNPTFLELSRIMAEVPGTAKYLQDRFDELQGTEKALALSTDSAQAATHRLHEEFGGIVQSGGAAAAALVNTDSAAKVLADTLSAVSQASDQLASVILEKLGGSLERLELQRTINELEAVKAKLGEAFKDQADIDALNGRLALLERRDQAVALSTKIIGERLRQAFGADAQAKIDAITEAIAAFPKEKIVEILPLLDALAAAQVVAFMRYLERGVTVNVAFAMAKFQIPSIALSPVLKFMGLDKIIGSFGAVAAKAATAAHSVDIFSGSTAGAGAAAGGAAEAVKEVTDILDDSIITLAEATANGIPAWAAARFEAAALAKTLADEVAEKAWTAQKGLINLSDALGEAGVSKEAFSLSVLFGILSGTLKDTGIDLSYLDDGIVSLAEAIEHNLNPAEQAALEIAKARITADQAAEEAANRANVELIKLAQAMGEKGVTGATVAFWAAAKMANEGTLTLTAALNLGLLPAQAALIQGYANEATAHQALKDAIYNVMVDMATFTLQLQGLSGPAADSVRELNNLGIQLGNTGLGRQALDFELAMREVNSAFGEGRRAAAEFAYGVGTELVSALQSALGQLLGGPTVETAQLQLQIDTLAYQLAVQEAAGATAEQTQAIRDQIAALQAQQDVYTAEHRVMQDRATLADQTLPTERELKDMVAEITRNIGIYSGKVDDLSWATDIQTLATANAVTQTDKLADVALGASDYMGFFTRSLGDSASAVTTKNYDLVTAAQHVIDVFNSITAPSGYQMGTPFVPSTGVYTLHRGEAVLTATEAARQRASEPQAGGTYNNYGRYQVVLPNVRDHRDFLREQGRILRGF